MRRATTLSELIFTLCILGYVLILAGLSFSYKLDSRVFPQIIMATTIFFLILRLVSIFNPGLGRMLEPEAYVPDKSGVRPKAVKENTKRDMWLRELGAVLSVSLLMAAVFLLGMFPALVLFLFFFLKLYGRKKWATSIVFTLSVSALLYLLFVVVLKTRLDPGILFEMLQLT